MSSVALTPDAVAFCLPVPGLPGLGACDRAPILVPNPLAREVRDSHSP